MNHKWNVRDFFAMWVAICRQEQELTRALLEGRLFSPRWRYLCVCGVCDEPIVYCEKFGLRHASLEHVGGVPRRMDKTGHTPTVVLCRNSKPDTRRLAS